MSRINVSSLVSTERLRLPVFTTAQRDALTPEAGMLIFNSTIQEVQIYFGNPDNGYKWQSAGADLAPIATSGAAAVKDGSTSALAADSAAAIKTVKPSATDGIYWINLPTVGPKQIYCIMDSGFDGGGWMMAMKATRGTTFSFGSSYWTSTNTLNETAYNTSDGDAKFETFNRFAAKDLLAVWPDLGANSGCFNTSRGHIWLENNFWQSGTRITLTSLFNTANEYFIRDANNFCGIGQFSRQTDVRFYGFNYSNDQNLARVRWGFGWNENGGGLWPNGNQGSDDVAGGIGMTGTQQGQVNYSAGDFIGCCQNVTGFNRSARVEVYVR
jgi:hypothetical protein